MGEKVTRSMFGRITSGGNQMEVLNSVFGYPKVLNYDIFHNAYRRMGIARRAIRAQVGFTWRKFPELVTADDNSESQVKEFNKQLKLLCENHKLFKILKKSDTLSMIGQYSILVICTKNGKTEEQLKRGTSVNEITQLAAYSEKQAKIEQWETNKASARYGLPKLYSISVQDEKNKSISYKVHHSRVIHITDRNDESEVFGAPFLEAGFNYLMDLYKVVGASAELFWILGNPGMVFNLSPDLVANDEAIASMEKSLEEYDNRLNRRLKTFGVDVKQLTPGAANPKNNVDILLQLISAAYETPTRILLGSEQGQLASSVDRDMFLSHIAGRQENFASDVILRPLINCLMDYGYLPKVEYEVEWPALVERDTSERISDAARVIQAVRQYVGPQGVVSEVLPVEEFRELLGLDPEIPETEYPTAGAGDSLAGDYSEPLSQLPMYDNESEPPPTSNGIFQRLRNLFPRRKSAQNRLKYVRQGVIMNAAHGNCDACGKFLSSEGSCTGCAGIGKEAFAELKKEYSDSLIGFKAQDVPEITEIDNHGMVRAIERGWSVEDIENALDNKQITLPAKEPSSKIYMCTNGRRVVVTDSGKIITMFGGD
ncbi:MAG: DUF1073 domain-containing protein [Defluviitaleaceae bacterium]|nr:DUF1073 domain-containing protein [Defluviitaleaceae bacterium]MCL2261676.1 DUF1073 domain-containing protein [Defluviitaleaceae bacterium]